MRGGCRKKRKKPPYTNRGVTGAALPPPSSTEGELNKVPLAVAAEIDWLTATTDCDKVGFEWWLAFKDLSAGHYQDWRNRWYQGARADGYRWGWSEKQGYIFISTGSTTPACFYRIAPASRNVSRLDLSVTVELAKANQGLARDSMPPKPTGPRNYTLISGTKPGETLYVGSRTSSQFGRLYDKGAESGQQEEGKLWRYEVELKSPRSKIVSDLLLTWMDGEAVLSHPSSSLAVAEKIIPFVYDWFDEREVKPVFDREGKNELVVQIGRGVTTDQKKIEWLTSQVRPTVQDFLSRGLEERLAEALGCEISRAKLDR